jgi:2-dehydro-3-deoxyphosphogluconate aldolase/(4S)-4-hydroxy-2-oxoglutarate aldolase
LACSLPSSSSDFLPVQTTAVPVSITEAGIVPVIALEQAKDAAPLADALLSGGIPLVEITFRTAAALEAIRSLTRERPGLLVGAGTVLTKENLQSAVQAGARFAVAPGLNPALVRFAAELGIAFIPGVATPSEVEQALSLGCYTLKFFPAELLGGVAMLNALFAPYGHTGVKFIPTGGVTPSNLESYLNCKAVAAVGGTWLAKKDDVAQGNWDGIRNQCAAAVETVRRVRAA